MKALRRGWKIAGVVGVGMLCLACGGCSTDRSIVRRYFDAGTAQARAGDCDRAIRNFNLAVQAGESDERCRRMIVSEVDDSVVGWAACKGVLADSYSGLARCYHDLGRPARAIEQKKNDAATCRALCEVAKRSGRARLQRWCANEAKALATLADWEQAAGP